MLGAEKNSALKDSSRHVIKMENRKFKTCALGPAIYRKR